MRGCGKPGQQGDFNLALDLVGFGGVALGERAVCAGADNGFYEVVEGAFEDFSVGEADGEFDGEGFFADGGFKFAVLAFVDSDPVVGAVADGGLHPVGGQLDGELFGRDVADDQERGFCGGIDAFPGEVEIDGALAEEDVVAVCPGAGHAVLHVEMVAGLGQLAGFVCQPEVGVEGEEVGDWADGPGVDFGEVGDRGVFAGVQGEALAEIGHLGCKGDGLAGGVHL